MEILVCIKRVPATGARITLTEDAQDIDTRNLGFTMSPHEECAVEEAVQIGEKHGGTTTVLTLGPAEAVEQLRHSLSVGIDQAILLQTDGQEWDPMATAQAITKAIQAEQANGRSLDLILFGNEAADTGGYQVGVRVAHALNLPCLAGVKGLDIREDGMLEARRETGGGWEIYELPLPAVITIKEGINLPRYPSVPGRLRAKKKSVQTSEPQGNGGGLDKIRLKTPPEQGSSVRILGDSAASVPEIIEILKELQLL
jgi:electron transfer flavoprotein beta subunit